MARQPTSAEVDRLISEQRIAFGKAREQPVVPLRIVAPAAPKRRERGPRSLTPPERATREHMLRLIEPAIAGHRPHRRLTRTEAFEVVVRQMQLTSGRLYRDDAIALANLAAFLAD